MRVTLFFILVLFSIYFNLNAQQAVKSQYLNEINGYKFKHLILNADSSDIGIPIVIGLHWRGSTPDEFGKFLQDFKSPVRLILLQGKYLDDEVNYSFFRIIPTDYYTLLPDEKMKILLQEGEDLSQFIKSISLLYKPIKKPIIIGASQGGDLSYVIGIRYNNLVSLSCPLLATTDNRIIRTLKKSIRKDSKIEVFHGLDDKIVLIDTVKQHVQVLIANKYKVKLHSFDNNTHSISNPMMKDFTDLIEKHLKN